MSTFFFPPSPTPHPLSGAVIYDPYRDVAGRNILPVGSDNFVTGWSNGTGETCTVTDYPINIPGVGDVIAKRITGNGAGSSKVKYQLMVSGSANPHTFTSSCLVLLMSGNAKLSCAETDPKTITGTMQRLASTLSNLASSYSYLTFQTNSPTDIIDIVVYAPAINLGSLAPYSVPSGIPLTALNYGVGSSLHNAQLGSAAGSDTNDPTWGATGMVFGADDFLKITSSWFDDMPSFTCITAYNSNSYGGGSGGRLWSKANKELLIRSANTIGYYNSRSDGNEYWTATKMGLVGANNIIAISHSPATPDIAPLIYLGTSDLTVTRATPKSGTVKSDAAYDMYIGNASGAGNSIDGTIYLQVWFPRILTDAQYLAAYRYIKSLLAARGVTV